MTVHVLQNPEQREACLASLARTDALLLIDRAVHDIARQAHYAGVPCIVYCLSDDLALAGICSATLPSFIKTADYDTWVALTERHTTHVLWD